MALTIKIRGDASHFSKTIAGVKIEATGLVGIMGKLATSQAAFGAALAAAAAGAVALGAGLAFIKDSSSKAAGIESLTMQFETLLGSAEAARSRMQEIKTFAASTPFEVANLSETSKLLQTLGGDMLATGKGLRMVGDAASIAGQPIQEVGLHIGRLFNAITSGTSAGESVARLQELGLMTGTVKRKFEDLAEAQKKGEKPILSQTQAMTLLQGVFAKTEGAMQRLSMTTEGKLSNMQDAIDNLKVSFGTGFNIGLRSALDATNSFLPQLEKKFSYAGELVGIAIKDSVEGNHKTISAVGGVIGEVLMAGVRSSIKIAFDTIIREGIGGYMSLGGHVTNSQGVKNSGAFISAAINAALGPGKSMAETVSGEIESGGLKKAIEDLKGSAGQRDWVKEQEKRVDEQIRLQKEANEKLGKIAVKETRQPIFVSR